MDERLTEYLSVMWNGEQSKELAIKTGVRDNFSETRNCFDLGGNP